MSTLEKIVVVLGADEAANEAVVSRRLEVAAASAPTLLLTVVHEASLDGYLGNTEIYAKLRQRLVDEAAEKAAALADRLGQSGIKAEVRAEWDWPRGDAIQRAAAEFGADLIILSFGLGHMRHIGSRDWRFLAECPLPVLVVNGAAERPYGSIVAAVDPVHAHAKPEALDVRIVGAARALEAVTGTKLELVHSFVPLARYEIGTDDIDRLPLEDAENALETSRRNALRQLASDAGIPGERTRLIEGGVESVLQSLMEQGEADLLVMGALARGRLAEFLIGSTAERLLRHAGADILLVKPAPN